ncbi:hypothetical protein [Salinarimonas soli]|uniref:Uncharacterized protein n=1 Tax=Salinarimonas soli TaxID=1638099 RepID=A0A5B2VB12_9HYPH|nr:hypothetical protein [Salinarimonas soli]KAA2235559.1 hypothetical protein F0L46_18825 [Salinarimonas soli]
MAAPQYPSCVIVKAVVDAAEALARELEPRQLQSAAVSIRMIAPKLARDLDTRARNAVMVRIMLARALDGQLGQFQD